MKKHDSRYKFDCIHFKYGMQALMQPVNQANYFASQVSLIRIKLTSTGISYSTMIWYSLTGRINPVISNPGVFKSVCFEIHKKQIK